MCMVATKRHPAYTSSAASSRMDGHLLRLARSVEHGDVRIALGRLGAGALVLRQLSTSRLAGGMNNSRERN